METPPFLQHCTFFFFSTFSFLFFSSSFPLRAGGETMIKSSWFYVKFKYAEKVSQYVFPPKGNMPPPPAFSLDGLLWLLGEANELGNFICECVSSGLMILG